MKINALEKRLLTIKLTLENKLKTNDMSFLGAHTQKLKDGGLATQAKIDDAAKKVITKFVNEHKLKKNLVDLKKMGHSEVEGEYKFCCTSEYPDNYFVISVIYKYNNQQLDDTMYGVYCFDVQGNKVDFDREKCKGHFYRNMQILGDI